MVITNSSTLNGRYAVQSVLGEVGPFDVSYLAWDLQDEREVVLREYYPLQFSKRASNGLTLEVNDPKNFEYGLGAYTAEAHRLMDIDHGAVINYQTNFKENGTIYSVCTYTPGASAYGYMTQQGGALSEEEAISIMNSILEGLKSCHANKLYHGGVWPKSIHLTPDGSPILMGFSQARFQLARHCEKFELVHLPGFTAPEQADKDIEAGPWWDIFGCAATLFYVLSGYQLNYQRERCTEEDIQSALHKETSISADLKPVLEKALAFDYKNRFDSLASFQHAIEEATAHKSLLSMHTNGHHTNGQSYATSVSALPGSSSSSEVVEEDVIDVREVRTMPSGQEAEKTQPQPAPFEAKVMKEKESPLSNQFLDPSINGTTTTSIVQQEPSQTPLLLGQAEARQPEPDAATGKSDKEVAQLLSKMVKWQQTLIAFILGFVFLVLFSALAIFAGPQVMELVKNNTSVNNAAFQSATLASASASTPLATVDSTGVSITQADIDSMYAAIRAQLEAELGRANSSQLESTTRTVSQSATREPSSTPLPQQSRQQPQEPVSSPASRSSYSLEEAIEPASDSQQSNMDRVEQPGLDEPPVGVNTAAADSSIVGNNQANGELTDSSQDRINELLRQREFQMYRTMGDSLLGQGFDELALQWYQSALQQDPANTYVAEQIRHIEQKRIAAYREEAAVDSLTQLIQNVTDENGVFFSPDTQPVMFNEANVHSKVRYPRSCLSQTNGGRVIARAIIDEGGVPKNLMIAKSLHAACDKEVLRVLGEAEFEPAIFNGQPVKAWYAFSVVFREE